MSLSCKQYAYIIFIMRILNNDLIKIIIIWGGYKGWKGRYGAMGNEGLDSHFLWQYV